MAYYTLRYTLLYSDSPAAVSHAFATLYWLNFASRYAAVSARFNP